MTTEIELYEGERIDRLGYQGLRIIQNPRKFKFTMDAFLLAGFIAPQPGHKILDLGTGGGVLPLLIAGAEPVAQVVGLEIQAELAAMAARSVALNHLENRITVIEGDLRNPPDSLPANSFDYVISNPPFFPAGQGIVSENTALALAKFEIACTLEEVVKAAARLVRAKGRVAFIYPAERLSHLLSNLEKHHLIPRRMRLIYPKPGANGNLVLLEGRPGAKGGLEVLPPLFIYDAAGEYSDEMMQIYHHNRS